MKSAPDDALPADRLALDEKVSEFGAATPVDSRSQVTHTISLPLGPRNFSVRATL
jgi:hypothetical protein